MQEMKAQSLGREDPLEEEMGAHSSIPAWEIPWAEEPGGLQTTGVQSLGWEDPLEKGMTTHSSIPAWEIP